ncbi:hypothetical protein E3U55_11015 [Filobacillus milosensis]|uniref:Uncharacterized protein n=1 Tax=Filobacillus milosensis TaxID=94137 RepID=A0A4Y8IHZ4_9BACI|nr:hypothetical protein E3U55_11015 [Filobacillus milosensis]
MGFFINGVVERNNAVFLRIKRMRFHLYLYEVDASNNEVKALFNEVSQHINRVKFQINGVALQINEIFQ